jgi:type I restriction enzyme S subunit
LSGVDLLPLGEIVQPTRPRVKPSDYPDLPFIGMEHVEAHSTKLLGTVPAATMKSSAVHFKPGDVLYGRLRPYLNKVYRPTFEGLCSAEFIVLPENERVDGSYLQYFLNSSAFVRYASHLNTGDRPRVDFEQLAPYEIPLPDIGEQRHIVAGIESQFSRLDEAVANLTRVRTSLARFAKAVLSAAVAGQLVETESAISEASGIAFESGSDLLGRVLLARVQHWTGRGLYSEPTPLDVRGLHALPKGWTWASADQLSDFITKGTTPASGKLSEGAGDVQFLKVYNLTFDGLLNRNYKPAFVSRETHLRDLARSKVRPGDVLINIVGPPLGQVSLVPDDLPEANINQAIARIRPVTPLSTKYVALALMAREVMDWAVRRAKTTAGQSNLTLELCRAIPIPLPPLAEQHRIVAEVDRRLSIIREVEAEVDTNLKRAQALRQAVLERAFRSETSGLD